MVGKHGGKGQLHRQLLTVLLMIYDAAAVSGAFFAALWVRFDFRFSLCHGFFSLHELF